MIFGMSAGSGESSGTYAALHTTCARYATAPTVAWISAMRNHVSAVRKICTKLVTMKITPVSCTAAWRLLV